MANELELTLQADESRILGDVYTQQRIHGRVSALIDKMELPEGSSYNYATVVYQRSGQTGAYDWEDVNPEDGTTNNCAPLANQVNPASTRLNYVAQQKAIKSNKICIVDIRNAYEAEEQIAATLENFSQEIVDVIEARDKLAYFTNAGHKIIVNDSLTEGSATMPQTPATYRMTQSVLDIIYRRLIRDGAGVKAYAQAGGKPQFVAIMSSQVQRDIVIEDASVRQDFNFAYQGSQQESVLLKAWGIDRGYGGFMQVIDDKMPRYNFVNNVWVEVPFYTTSATTIGTQLIPNPDYNTAQYEDVYIWHPQVVARQMPRPKTSAGAMTSFGPYQWNGSVFWANIQSELEGESYNPFNAWGRYWAWLYWAYKPIKQNLGYILRARICNEVDESTCSYP